VSPHHPIGGETSAVLAWDSPVPGLGEESHVPEELGIGARCSAQQAAEAVIHRQSLPAHPLFPPKRKAAGAAGDHGPSFLPPAPATTRAYGEDPAFTPCEVHGLMMTLTEEPNSTGLTRGNTKLCCWRRKGCAAYFESVCHD